MPSLVGRKRRLQGHVQHGGHVYEADLRSVQAFQSVWENVEFDHSRLSMGDFRASKWVNCKITKTTLYGGNFNAATLHGVVVTDCDAEQASFAGAVLRDIVFRDCRLAYSSFVGATLHNVIFVDCNLHGSDLDYAEATGVQYSKCNLWSAKTAFGCTFWNSGFDVETCNRYLALIARVYPNTETQKALTAIAGEATYKAVSRLMDTEPDRDAPAF